MSSVPTGPDPTTRMDEASLIFAAAASRAAFLSVKDMMSSFLTGVGYLKPEAMIR